MSITKSQKGFRSIARHTGQLAEENQLNSKPANLECHLRRGQKHTCVFGKIVDVHNRTLPLVVDKALFQNHNLDHLQSHQYRPALGGRKVKWPQGETHILRLDDNQVVNLPASLDLVH
jgi:hypothetical protein